MCSIMRENYQDAIFSREVLNFQFWCRVESIQKRSTAKQEIITTKVFALHGFMTSMPPFKMNDSFNQLVSAHPQATPRIDRAAVLFDLFVGIPVDSVGLLVVEEETMLFSSLAMALVRYGTGLR